jgi:hypothetical protein
MSAIVSKSYIALIKQTPATPLTIPTSPVMQKVNFLTADLAGEVMTKASNHVRADRASTDLIRMGLDVKGGYTFEFQWENSLADELLAGFMWSTWGTGGTLSKIIKNGSTYQPFFIEQGHTDIGQYHRFLGMACNVLTLSIPDRGEITGGYQFIGLSTSLEDAVPSGATYTAAASTPVFSAGYNVSQIAIDGTPLSSCIIKNVSLELNNNVTPKTGPGVIGACETNPHRLTITGKMSAYFENDDMYDRLHNGTPFALKITLLDSNSKSYIITLPRLFLSANKAPLGGVDEDVMENLEFTAAYDGTATCMMQIEKTA